MFCTVSGVLFLTIPYIFVFVFLTPVFYIFPTVNYFCVAAHVNLKISVDFYLR